MKDLIHYLATSLAGQPDQVEITCGPGKYGQTVSLKVAASDLNVVIGKQGRTAKAMRTLMAAAAGKKGERWFLEIGQAGLNAPVESEYRDHPDDPEDFKESQESRESREGH